MAAPKGSNSYPLRISRVDADAARGLVVYVAQGWQLLCRLVGSGCAAGFNMVGVFVTQQRGGCSAPATAEALLNSDAPGGIRTHDLRLRRRHRPATTNAGR